VCATDLHDVLPSSEATLDADPMTVSFEVNQRQNIEVLLGLADQNPNRLISVAFETTNAELLQSYLAGHGVTVPDKVKTAADGVRSFTSQSPRDMW
jgi:hypothetical protein